MKKLYSILIVLVTSFIMCFNVFAQNPTSNTPNALSQNNVQKVSNFILQNNLETEHKQNLYKLADKCAQEGKEVLDITPIYFNTDKSFKSLQTKGTGLITGSMTISHIDQQIYVNITVNSPDAITYMTADLDARDIGSFRHSDYYKGYRAPFPTQYEQFDFIYTGSNVFVTIQVTGSVSGPLGSGNFATPSKNYYLN